MQDFHKLHVWQRGHELALEAYRATAGFPSAELYGLTSQIRRAAASIPANIAEGCGLSSAAELKRFLHISMGSASELEYHLLLARDLHYLKDDVYDSLNGELVEIRKMLNRFLQALSAAR